MLALWKENYDKPRQHIKNQRHYFANKGLYSQSYGFSSSHVQMWELEHKEDWVLKNWCFTIMVLEKTLESLLDSKEFKSVNFKINQPWIFTGRTDTEAEAQILWPLDVKWKRLTHWKGPWCRERLRARGEAGDRMRWLYGITNTMDMIFSKLWETGKDRETWHAAIHGATKRWTCVSHWTTKCWEVLSPS